MKTVLLPLSHKKTADTADSLVWLSTCQVEREGTHAHVKHQLVDQHEGLPRLHCVRPSDTPRCMCSDTSMRKAQEVTD
eukprot:274000-Amphidinium_carterae.2